MMKIAVVGADKQKEVFNKMPCNNAELVFVDYPVDLTGDEDVIFDFLIEESPEVIEGYAEAGVSDKVRIFVNIPMTTLATLQYMNQEHELRFFGFNGMNGLFNSNILEVSALGNAEEKMISDVADALGIKYKLVDDRVGMVTPRVICMIINEAFYTLNEGTADVKDIDTGMKLGTNYPFGPFEWAEKIGIDKVFELIEAVYNDTQDERYAISPLLKKEYLKVLNSY